MLNKINDFSKLVVDRYKSPTPTFWKIMQPIGLFAFGGLSAIQNELSDNDPKWIKWLFTFAIGGLAILFGRLGSKDTNITHK